MLESDLLSAMDDLAISIATGPIIRYQHYMKTIFIVLSLSAGAWAVNKTVEVMNYASAVMEHPIER